MPMDKEIWDFKMNKGKKDLKLLKAVEEREREQKAD